MAAFGTFTAGQVLTAAELNAAGTWADYTPSWTQSATITKTVNWARYSQFNKLVFVSIKMTASSAGTANNVIKIGLPVAASSNNFLMGTAVWSSSGATPTSRGLYVFYDTSTTVKFLDTGAETDYPNSYFGQTAGTATTIDTGQVMWMHLTYEAS